MTTTPELGWSAQLADQLDWHWTAQARPRLSGLTDEEYLWEPVPGAWNLRRRGQPGAADIGGGDWVIDFAFPEPSPAPVTTIAWRLAHILVGVLGARNHTYFGGEEVTYQTFRYHHTAAAALAVLDDSYRRWIDGVRDLSPQALAERCREQGHESDPMAALVLHINREMIHHLAEVALLRDLYARHSG